ncbi:hypothetical protein [uncultured Acetobacteroides sp.]|uniref:hypothetical protein n=1 Tax=uncultured Acetobacteroides sp. TaxID=1760811 RepID=UPI0029F48248|nr:hypothetical protein [uncultured Acetobacteroides sp.]
MSNRHITILALALTAATYGCVQKSESSSEKSKPQASSTDKQAASTAPASTPSDTEKLTALANGDTLGFWPIKNNPAPLKGAILPHKRIIAYYGNIYSKRMGILGEYPPKELWRRLNIEVKAWEEADPTTPVQPAIHYIAVVAQGIPQKDGKYRMRMPRRQIDSALAIAKMGNAIVFLDIQVGKSSVQEEVPLLEKYLKMPHVHLGIDPEFSMKTGSIPGHKIGTMDADDVNFCSEYLAKLVKANNIPPKILVVHRFTQGMVRRYRDIKLRPEVQVVMNMDGWGEPVLKKNTYKQYVYKEPVQFAGFKLFYKNDLKKAPHRLLTPPELMKLKPKPIYIMYQ